MKNKKIIKKFIVAIMIFSMVAMYGYMPLARAASLTNASVLITDSDTSVSLVSHTVTFTTGQDLTAGYMIDLDFPAGVNLVTATSTCPANSTGAIAGQVVTCTVDGGQTLAAGAYTITVASTTNPGTTGSYSIDIITETDASIEVEKSEVRFFIIDDVTMHAHVDSTLEFVVSGVASSTALNGTFLCNALTTATTTDFGTLIPGVAKTICQTLQVTTNATIGFNVTVEQDSELENTTTDNINSFNNSPDDTGSTTAEAWASPTGVLDADHTYGHLGVTSNDTDLDSGTGFEDLYNVANTPHYVGLNAADAQEVMHHNGPADGSTQDKGEVMVGYTAEINALQQAGDYTNTLTYIATATY
ncbi:hypothetical protein KAI92_02485 [Candidatus Parcubacteria bacterium]|nr:hypothetical protein [Candidatus Parcubacteria bacterium]